MLDLQALSVQSWHKDRSPFSSIAASLRSSSAAVEGPLRSELQIPRGAVFSSWQVIDLGSPKRQLSFFLVTHSFSGEPAWTPAVHQPWNKIWASWKAASGTWQGFTLKQLSCMANPRDQTHSV